MAQSQGHAPPDCQEVRAEARAAQEEIKRALSWCGSVGRRVGAVGGLASSCRARHSCVLGGSVTHVEHSQALFACQKAKACICCREELLRATGQAFIGGALGGAEHMLRLIRQPSVTHTHTELRCFLQPSAFDGLDGAVAEPEQTYPMGDTAKTWVPQTGCTLRVSQASFELPCRG